MSESTSNRNLTSEERTLVCWMLEHGAPDAPQFLTQLERAQVLPTRCPCGCASIDFSIDGQPKPTGELRPLVDFVFGSGEELSGIFVFEQSGVLLAWRFMVWLAMHRRHYRVLILYDHLQMPYVCEIREHFYGALREVGMYVS